MADLQHYEFVVSQKLEGKWRMRRIIAVIGYVLFALVFFALGTTTKLLFPLLALTPLFLWMLIFFTGSGWTISQPVSVRFPGMYSIRHPFTAEAAAPEAGDARWFWFPGSTTEDTGIKKF